MPRQQMRASDPVYPQVPANFDHGLIPHGPDHIHQPVSSSAPFVLPDLPGIQTQVGVSDWLPTPPTSMYVSASYPPRSHHFPDNSSQPSWFEQSYSDPVSSIHENWPSPSRPLTRTYSTDNFILPSHRTAAVPVPTNSMQRMSSTRAPQVPRLQTGGPAAPQFEYGQFDYVPKPTPPMVIRGPVHGQTHNEQPVTWNTEGFQ